MENEMIQKKSRVMLNVFLTNYLLFFHLMSNISSAMDLRTKQHLVGSSPTTCSFSASREGHCKTY